jgi:hypothetical protein
MKQRRTLVEARHGQGRSGWGIFVGVGDQSPGRRAREFSPSLEAGRGDGASVELLKYGAAAVGWSRREAGAAR